MTLPENKVKLSVIVPTYKVEAYIEKCIRSLEDQDLPKEEYEIIVINDGSPDRCREIVEELQKEFSNIVLINQENQGVSMARNNGFNIARGEFIMPVDADDYVFPKSFGLSINKLEQKNLDILYTGFSIIDEKEEISWQTNYKEMENVIFNGVEGYFSGRGEGVRDPDGSWAKLYRRNLILNYNITYPKNVPILEDGLFLGKVFSVAERVGFSDELLYYRTIRKGSAMNSDLFFSDKAVNGFITAANDLREFAAKQSLNSEQAGLINHCIVKFVLLPLNAALSYKNLKEYFVIVKRLNKAGFKKLETAGVLEPYLEYAKYYNLSPFYMGLIYLKNKLLNK